MGFAERVGVGIYNASVRRRNKFVRGEYHVQSKLRVGASYLHSVGTNVVNDFSTGHNQMFPFQIPKQQKHKKHKRQRNRSYRYRSF